MHDRAQLHCEFVRRFRFGAAGTPATDDDLDAIEKSLNVILPLAYRSFMRTHGAVYAPDVLGAVVDQNLDHPDLQEIWSARAVVSDTKVMWSGGMPEELTAFANDCMGNIFSFKRLPEFDARPDDAPVWFFDHDYGTVHELSESFDALLNWYVKHIYSV
jgi:hypothetical protein